ncbi:GUN4 domain-containing protein, partial [Microcoleus sp. B13-B4]
WLWAFSFLYFTRCRHLSFFDLNPYENIMLRRQGLGSVLIDFGIARQPTAPGKLRTNTNVGTRYYAPIELSEKRRECGSYSDVYSLAATLYVMLTGEMPFPSEFRKQNVLLIPPKQHNDQISNRVNAAIIKGMELEPQNRPQSVQEWLDLVMPKKVALDLGIAKKAETVQLNLLETVQLNLLDLVIPKPAPPETARVISAVGMDYINLRNLLAAKKWQEADEETLRVMLKVAGREKEGWLDTKSIEKFPCEDLRTIDQLWVKYSDGRFGFSVQKRIYQSLGGTRKYDITVSEAFGDQVGWKKNDKWLYYKDLTFSERAPEAHLPLGGMVNGFKGRIGGRWCFCFFASRLVDCNI